MAGEDICTEGLGGSPCTSVVPHVPGMSHSQNRNKPRAPSALGEAAPAPPMSPGCRGWAGGAGHGSTPLHPHCDSHPCVTPHPPRVRSQRRAHTSTCAPPCARTPKSTRGRSPPVCATLPTRVCDTPHPWATLPLPRMRTPQPAQPPWPRSRGHTALTCGQTPCVLTQSAPAALCARTHSGSVPHPRVNPPPASVPPSRTRTDCPHSCLGQGAQGWRAGGSRLSLT